MSHFPAFFTLEDYQTLAERLRLPAVKRPFGNVPAAFKRAKLVLAVPSLFFVFQIGVSLRHVAYPGDVLWTEEGCRFSWRVMLAEKTGQATFRVVQDDKTRTVYPSEYLTPQQAKQMAFRPDMILQFAHFLARDAGFGAGARVYAEVWVSVNGRPSKRFVDPETDPAAEPHSLAKRRWVTP